MVDMKAFILLLLLFVTLSHGDTFRELYAKYDISYAIFGTIGESEAKLVIDPDRKRYTITIEAEAKGLAKVMSNRRIERYISSGIVKKSLLIPQQFETLTKKGKYFQERHIYRFDRKEKKIIHETYVVDKDREKRSKEQLSFWAEDDILTLFFNLHHYVKQGICAGSFCKLAAVGANDKDGDVDIAPTEKYLKVILHRRIFASKQGEIYLHMRKDGIADFAMLKDVIFFGDVKAKATTIRKK
jgi:hypothetical protein